MDFIVDSDGEVYVNEANTVPGSLAAYLFSPLGMSYADAVGAAIEDAVARKRKKNCPNTILRCCSSTSTQVQTLAKSGAR